MGIVPWGNGVLTFRPIEPGRKTSGRGATARVGRSGSAGAQPISDSHKIGERSRLHLGHDIRALGLNGALGGAELVRDLFVQFAFDDGIKYFTLARRKAF